MTNASGISPTEFKVLILPKPVEEKTPGGVFIPDPVREKDKMAGVEGTIIAMAPAAFSYLKDEEWNGQAPKAGDRVLLAKYSGTWRKGKDGVEYLLIADKDVLATLED